MVARPVDPLGEAPENHRRIRRRLRHQFRLKIAVLIDGMAILIDD